jgi:hypothetical protein
MNPPLQCSMQCKNGCGDAVILYSFGGFSQALNESTAAVYGDPHTGRSIHYKVVVTCSARSPDTDMRIKLEPPVLMPDNRVCFEPNYYLI